MRARLPVTPIPLVPVQIIDRKDLLRQLQRPVRMLRRRPAGVPRNCSMATGVGHSATRSTLCQKQPSDLLKRSSFGDVRRESSSIEGNRSSSEDGRKGEQCQESFHEQALGSRNRSLYDVYNAWQYGARAVGLYSKVVGGSRNL